jgi:hypothetical protein
MYKVKIYNRVQAHMTDTVLKIVNMTSEANDYNKIKQTVLMHSLHKVYEVSACKRGYYFFWTPSIIS